MIIYVSKSASIKLVQHQEQVFDLWKKKAKIDDHSRGDNLEIR